MNYAVKNKIYKLIDFNLKITYNIYYKKEVVIYEEKK